MPENQNLINKQNILLFLLLVITTTFIRLGNDFYLQFFSEIIQYFKIEEDEVNHLIRFNFAGYAIMSIMAGPLIDSFSKKKVFMIALSLYILSSTICYFAENFNVLLFGRFLSGLSESILHIVAWVIIFDHFSIIQSGEMSGIIKGTSKTLLIIIPLLAVWFSNIYHWHLVFIIFPLLSILAFVIAIYAIKNNTPDVSNKLGLKVLLGNYLRMIKNFEFITYISIYAITSSAYIVFFSNASIVFVDSHLTLEKFSYFRTSFSVVYVLFSFLSVYVISRKGIDYTKNIGLIVFLVGIFGVFIISAIDETNVNLIFLFTSIVAIGSAFMIGFLLKAINIFPELKGTSMAIGTIITGVISARKIFWTQVFFDGTIFPAAAIIFGGSIIAIILLSILYYKKSIKRS